MKTLVSGILAYLEVIWLSHEHILPFLSGSSVGFFNLSHYFNPIFKQKGGNVLSHYEALRK